MPVISLSHASNIVIPHSNHATLFPFCACVQATLEEECATLRDTVEQQGNQISSLKQRLHDANDDLLISQSSSFEAHSTGTPELETLREKLLRANDELSAVQVQLMEQQVAHHEP